jgi:mannonate dehydratase
VRGHPLLRERGKILYVHFVTSRGDVAFQECFNNEGNSDMFDDEDPKQVGFAGFLIPDHVPQMIDDTPWGHRARAYSIGYMTALLEVVNAM